MIVPLLSRVLANPYVYRLFAMSVGGTRALKRVCRQYIQAAPGSRILDLGCGPGFMCTLLSQCDYTGVDISESYIDQAKHLYGNRAAFYCSDFANFAPQKGSFDRCIAIGLLHHINDEQAHQFFRLTYEALKPGGKLVTMDACHADGQSAFVRWMLNHDRGKFVRREEQYRALAQSAYPAPAAELRRDLLRIPYSSLLMTCVKAA